MEINPHAGRGFTVHGTDKVASAGSCFAQRIAQALKAARNNYYVVENGPAFLSTEEKISQGFGIYSARYGNVYTSLQLLQLLRRSMGTFDSGELPWFNSAGRAIDPFRPAAIPDGFIDSAACMADRRAHLEAVRRMFSNLDVFIFTLGLTESWMSVHDHAVFPVCPGSGLGGVYHPDRYRFHNFRVNEVVEHLELFLSELSTVNPKARIILTVSPVPLVATFEPRHVLQSTVYYKSVLRVAAEEVVRNHSHVEYFASYEIVTATGDSRAYYKDDLRTVSEEAVKHVTDCFLQWSSTQDAKAFDSPIRAIELAKNPAVMCDEEQIESALTKEGI